MFYLVLILSHPGKSDLFVHDEWETPGLCKTCRSQCYFCQPAALSLTLLQPLCMLQYAANQWTVWEDRLKFTLSLKKDKHSCGMNGWIRTYWWQPIHISLKYFLMEYSSFGTTFFDILGAVLRTNTLRIGVHVESVLCGQKLPDLKCLCLNFMVNF